MLACYHDKPATLVAGSVDLLQPDTVDEYPLLKAIVDCLTRQ